MKLAPICFALGTAVFALSSASAATYSFDALSNGAIAGQDGWFVLPSSGDLSDVVQNGTGSNTTKVMANPGPPGTGVHRMARTNGGPSGFTFGSLAGATGLTLSFDTQVHNDTSIANELDFINFALADVNDANSSPTLAYRQFGNATPQVAYAGSGGGSGTFNLPGTPTGDWIRLSLVMNFVTPGSGGTITYQDLTGGGGLITIASGLNLGNPAAVESLWNTMWSRSDNGLGGATSLAVIDNLTISPSFTVVPEMNGAWIAAGATLLLAGHGLRKYRARHALT